MNLVLQQSSSKMDVISSIFLLFIIFNNVQDAQLKMYQVKMQYEALFDGVGLDSSSEDSITKLKGLPGPMGDSGVQGPRVERGEKGDKGDQGAQGPMGPKGDTGDKGTSGRDGVAGIIGAPGLPGERGNLGFPGIKGQKGEPGVPPEEDEASYSPGEVKYKSPSRPAESCQYLNIREEGQNKINDVYYVYPSDPFEVHCNFYSKEMCLVYYYMPQYDIPNKIIEFKKDRAFWMTEMKFDLYKFYGINFRQLLWFQAQANSTITQTIRFYCKNISVRSNRTNSLQLLAWNQKIIDLEESRESPVHYEIFLGMDKCEDSTDGDEEFKYTDITLEGIPFYFPIIDFYIRDIRSSPQFGLFEPVRLCAKF